MARAKWTPPDDELASEIDAMVDLYRQQQQTEAAYKAALAKLAAKDVPVAHLADRLGIERKTVYRHLGRSMT